MDDTTTSRRGFLAASALGAAGVAVGTARMTRAAAEPAARADAQSASARAAGSTCLRLSPTEEVGPFYVAYDRVRENVRAGQAGIALRLHVRVINVSTCRPIRGAALDIWQANARGTYSDEAQEDTVGQTWLRGVQLTDSSGRVTFRTIMPGWYEGRVNHIHAKVRVKGTVKNHRYTGGTTAHIGQMFFPQAINNTCAKVSPYTSNTNDRITNAEDRVYTRQGGARSRLTMTGSPTKGYVGHITLGVTP
jgi:protocatechuate 3,4-dioxygenase beta subunit